jgi:amino acid permease
MTLASVCEASVIEKKKYDVFVDMSSVVKDFIYTGINRTTIHAMLRELVYQRELEKFGQRNWMMIAIAIFIILIGLGFAIKWIFSTEGIIQTLTGVGPARVAP